MMNYFNRMIGTAVFTLMCIAASTLLLPIAHAEDAPLGDITDNAAPPLIQEMVGTWTVQQRFWPGAHAKAVDLPPAVVRRTMVGNAVLQERMTLAPESDQPAFERVAYFTYNIVNQQYEYFSVDTRAPQIMNERSYEAQNPASPQGKGGVTLYGGENFVAPQWGDAKNVPFRYRIVIGNIVNDKQSVRLYLTPLSGGNAVEFLAFEYLYSRRK